MNSEKSNNFGTQLTSPAFTKVPAGRQLLNRLTSLLFYLSILAFIIGFNFTDVMVGNWCQQFFPDLGGRSIRDVVFKDSLTGYAITTTNTPYILKTINGGDNWSIIFTDNNIQLLNMTFLNNNTGFVGRGYTPNGDAIYKTTNGGANWSPVNTPTDIIPAGMFVLSPDTIWITDSDGLVGGLYRTINGGTSWIRQVNLGGANPNKIYMFNQYFGFMANLTQLYRTLDGGYNWAPVSGGPWTDIYFVDNLTGWKANYDLKKSTNGGLSWFAETIPAGGIIASSDVLSLSVLKNDTLWGSGGGVWYGGSIYRGILYRTTNGGSNWYFQIPDTSFGIGYYNKVQFINNKTGWASGNTGSIIKDIHTTSGGDTTFLLGVEQIGIESPERFRLNQNYPNPFNPNTVISYQLKLSGFVTLKVYDIAGKEIVTLVNQKQNSGRYEVKFSGFGYSSGVYFYTLKATSGKEVFTETRKMILIK